MPETSPKSDRKSARKFDGKRLVVASHNEGKVLEITALLAPFDMEVLPYFLPDPETGTQRRHGRAFRHHRDAKVFFAAKRDELDDGRQQHRLLGQITVGRRQRRGDGRGID